MNKILLDKLSSIDKIEYYVREGTQYENYGGGLILAVIGFSAASCFIGVGQLVQAARILTLSIEAMLILFLLTLSYNVYKKYKLEKEFTEKALKVK